MSEALLRALMQLFALASGEEDIIRESRNIVERFLRQELNQELARKYLALYDEYKEIYHPESEPELGTETVALDKQTVEKATNAINQELTQHQKVVVLLRLLEYIYADHQISEHEWEFLNKVADIFKIEEQEFQDAIAFIESSPSAIPDRSELLIVNNQDALSDREYNHHLKAYHFDDTILVLRIPSVNMFAFRFFGQKELYLNSQPIKDSKVYILSNGASIRGQGIHPIYYSDVVNKFLKSSVGTNIVFSAEDIEYEFDSGDYGVRGVTLSEESGNLIGIMGSSGSGKTTLLNILNGNMPPTSGQVTLNGVDIHYEKDKIEGVIGYVSQDDLLFEGLTVFRNLYYNAQLCFKDYTEEQLYETVNSLLQSLGLYEVRHLRVGSPMDKVISGGQRKRLNIALELIREPSVLFVDEPTSGLSSHDSENIMDLLKELALKGKLVFVVIHQPSSEIFKMFDNLLILDTGGYPIYYGNPIDSVIYFKRSVNHVKSWESECPSCGNVNPEQVFNIIEAKVLDENGYESPNRKTLPSEWFAEFKERIASQVSIKKPPSEIPESTFSLPGKLKQLKIFITRDILTKLRNKTYLSINLFETPILALILAYFVKFYPPGESNQAGYVFFQNDNLSAFIFMAVIVALFVGLTVSAEEIIKDQQIRKREQFLNLSTGSYLWSKILIMFGLSAIQTLLFVVVGNSILEIKGMYLDYWLVLFSTACFANLLGLNISSAFNSAVTIYILIPLLLIPQLLFSGVIIKFDKLNPSITSHDKVPVVGELMASRWAFEALAVNQFKNNQYQKNLFSFQKALSNLQYKKNYWIPELQGKVNALDQFGKDEKGKARESIALIRNELRNYNKADPLIKFEGISNIQYPLSDKVQEKLSQYLKNLKKGYREKYNAVMGKKEDKLRQLREKGVNIAQLKKQHQNKRLKQLVTNQTSLEKIIEVGDRLIPQGDPIFRPSPSLRAHFFAPAKQIFGSQLSTYWVNILILWGMTVLLIVTLYFDVLRKVLEYPAVWAKKLVR